MSFDASFTLDTHPTDALLAAGFSGLSVEDIDTFVDEQPPAMTTTESPINADQVLSVQIDPLEALAQFETISLANAPDMHKAFNGAQLGQQLSLDIDLGLNFNDAVVPLSVNMLIDELDALQTISVGDKTAGQLTLGFDEVVHATSHTIEAPGIDYTDIKTPTDFTLDV